MAIWFDVKEVRDFLIANNKVFTLRKPRREGFDTAMFHDSDGNALSFGKVLIKLIKETAVMSDLIPYVKESGLKSIEEWYAKGQILSGTSLNLYEVTRITST